MSVTAKTKRALVIRLGEQQDKAWNKINGDKDVPLVQAMQKKCRFQVGHDIGKSKGNESWHCWGIQENDGIMQTWRCGIYSLFWAWPADERRAQRRGGRTG